MPERREGRLARWSRLKSQDGVGADEDVSAESKKQTGEADAPAAAEAPGMARPDPATLPGGVQTRNFVPPMVPLAGPEDEDTAYEAPPAEALAMLNGEMPHDATPAVAGGRVEEDPEVEDGPELTPEEEEIVKQLPPLESLTKDSDFTPFFADKVPDFIRRRAMRVLWGSDPLFGFQDGLDDYAENFRAIDKVIDAATHSSYDPAKGYRLENDADADAEEGAGDAEVAGADAEDEREQDVEPDDAAAADEAPEPGDEPPVASSSVRKPETRG